MGLKKGQTNNPAGRPKGTINKANRELRDMIKDFLTENLENFQEEFANLDTKDKLKFIADIFPYGLPKYQPVEMEKKGNGLETQKNAFQQVNDYLEAKNREASEFLSDLPPFTRQQ